MYNISRRNMQVSFVPENLKRVRREREKSQKEFAELLEINYQNYSKIERGLYTPSLTRILEICEKLDITPNDLLLEKRSYDDLKEEIETKLNFQIFKFIKKIYNWEKVREEAFEFKFQGDEEKEKEALQDLLDSLLKSNKDYWSVINYLYFKELNEDIKRISMHTLKEIFKSEHISDLNERDFQMKLFGDLRDIYR